MVKACRSQTQLTLLEHTLYAERRGTHQIGICNKQLNVLAITDTKYCIDVRNNIRVNDANTMNSERRVLIPRSYKSSNSELDVLSHHAVYKFRPDDSAFWAPCSGHSSLE